MNKTNFIINKIKRKQFQEYKNKFKEVSYNKKNIERNKQWKLLSQEEQKKELMKIVDDIYEKKPI